MFSAQRMLYEGRAGYSFTVNLHDIWLFDVSCSEVPEVKDYRELHRLKNPKYTTLSIDKWNGWDALRKTARTRTSEGSVSTRRVASMTVEEARELAKKSPAVSTDGDELIIDRLIDRFCRIGITRDKGGDGEVCFNIGANFSRIPPGTTSGRHVITSADIDALSAAHFERSCKLGFAPACSRPEIARVEADQQRRDAEQKREARDERASSAKVMTAAQQTVRAQLKAPSQASWGAQSIIDQSGSCSLVKLSVDAPNSFGVMLRAWWLVTISLTGGESFTPQQFPTDPSRLDVVAYKSLSLWDSCR